MEQRPSGEFPGAHSREPTTAQARRVNWSRLSAVCLGLGALVVGGVLIAMATTRDAPPKPLAQVLDVVEQPLDLKVRVAPSSDARRDDALARTRLEARTQALQPADDDGLELEAREPAIGQAEPASTASPIALIAIPVAIAVPAGSAAPGPGATAQPLNDSAAIATAQSVNPATPNVVNSASVATQPDEPPPGAELGFTYCGEVTCNVGFKCCCSQCVPGEQECESAACEAYSGLSVSVPCGMDLCQAGDVCCDPRCGACGRAGECPEEPCG